MFAPGLREVAQIILTLPLAFPVVREVGFDPIRFGVIIVMVMELGLITPPVGLNVFVIDAVVRDVPLGAIFRGVAPFILTDIARLSLLIAFPIIVVFLPRTMH
jgi:C4-dicarboxylate transporter, DctM subunit